MWMVSYESRGIEELVDKTKLNEELKLFQEFIGKEFSQTAVDGSNRSNTMPSSFEGENSPTNTQ
jgi:hypothetical protein